MFLAGAACGMGAAHGVSLPAMAASVWWPRAAALLPGALAWRRVPASAVWLLVAGLAAIWSGARVQERDLRREAGAERPWSPAVAHAPRVAAVLRISGFATPRDSGRWQAPARVLAVAAGTVDGPSRHDGVLLTGPGHPPGPGDVVAGRPLFRVPRRPAVAGGFDDRCYLAGRGLHWRAQADTLAVLVRPAVPRTFACLRGDLAARLDRLLPPPEAAVASAVLLGLRDPGARRTAGTFAGLGLAHLFAVSGLHVGLVAGLVVVLLRASASGRGVRLAVLGVFLPVYMALTGLPASVVRAGGAVCLAQAVATGGRRPQGLRTLGLLFWAVVVWDPARCLDAGALLSYLAAGAILAAGSLGRTFRRASLPVAGAGVSMAAQWGTLPVVAGSFGVLSPWSTVANVVAVPWFGAGVSLLVLALVCDPVWPWAAEGVAGWAWLLLRLLSAAVAWVSPRLAGHTWGYLPFGPGAMVVWLAFTLVGGFLLRRGGRWALALPAAFAAGALVLGPCRRDLPPRQGPLAVQFAVGQGDCAFIAFPDGWCGLVDTAGRWGDRPDQGAFARSVAPWLKRRGVRRLDAVVLTHGHRDHTGGAAALAGEFPVGLWYVGGRGGAMVFTGRAPVWSRLDTTRVVHRWKEWTLLVHDPVQLGTRPDHENDASLALELRRAGQAVALWTGDLETAGEERLLAAGLVPRGVTVWKAGHHGSSTSGSAAFMAALAPRLVLVSCGVGNRYGHPDHGPWLAGTDTAAVLRTDLDGSVTLRWDSQGRLEAASTAGTAPRLDRRRAGS